MRALATVPGTGEEVCKLGRRWCSCVVVVLVSTCGTNGGWVVEVPSTGAQGVLEFEAWSRFLLGCNCEFDFALLTVDCFVIRRRTSQEEGRKKLGIYIGYYRVRSCVPTCGATSILDTIKLQSSTMKWPAAHHPPPPPWPKIPSPPFNGV
jgi:hypothetical protein